MEIINFDSRDLYKKVANVLKNGGIILHPTETCYGLAVDIFNEKALKKLYKVKNMAENKPVSILVDRLEMAFEYAIFSDKAYSLARKYWPGPLSLVLPRNIALPAFFNKDEAFVSLRVSSDAFCRKMVKEFHNPVTTTSANRTGEKQFYKIDFEKDKDFLKLIDLIVDAGEIYENKPSTLVKVEGKRIQILRQGALEIIKEDF
ncbi:MAG: L-threonylcarbamoyladenylate synthase [Candidatus Gracilibacteria bacterium]|jgi:L-threonylcarbamoyladenylate synthase